MLFNFYTDSKYMETYNRWHLIFLILFSGIYVYLNGSVAKLLLTIVLTLVIGLIVENIRAIRIGPGDTKMIIISAVFLLITTNLKTLFIALFSIILMKIYITTIAVTFVAIALLYHKIVKQKKIGDGSFRFYAYTVTIKQMANKKLPTINLNIPATGGIFLSTMTLHFIF